MITTSAFGTAPDGSAVTLYTLENERIAVRVMDFGATIVGIDVPDADGVREDVVLGFDSVEGYIGNDAGFGMTIAPCANRIAGARCTIDGAEWELVANENGNNLHTDRAHALQQRMWDVEVDEDACSVRMTAHLAHGELGLPGARTFAATFTLAADGVLRLEYRAESDRRTYVAMTNHAYFNLAGHASGSVLDQVVTIDAASYLPVDAQLIPTGEIAPVAGTPFDFTAPAPLGARIDADDEQIRFGAGYDHCFCIDGYRSSGLLRRALRAEDMASGRTLEIRVTDPGLQLYTGNYLDEACAKGGAVYTRHSGFAAEPELYPNTVNTPGFPQALCGPEHPYASTIEYRFGTL